MNLELPTLLEAEVLAEHIDGLGHMNTKIYAHFAREGAGELLRRLGIGMDGELIPAFPDTYTRFHKEQLEGEPLALRGGVLGVEEGALRLYLELINRTTTDVAATHVQTAILQHAGMRTRGPFPSAVVNAALAERVSLPEYARPRTLSIEPMEPRLTLEEAEARGLGVTVEPVVVDEGSCDEEGYLRVDNSHMLFAIAHGRQPNQMSERITDNNFRDADGRLLGWAMMESRACLFRLPRSGERLKAFRATTRLLDKVHCSTGWIFATTGELCAVVQIVALAFDIAARKPVPIPDGDRRELQAAYHPDLD